MGDKKQAKFVDALLWFYFKLFRESYGGEGGLSTGARTKEGIERIRKAVTKHGRYSAAAKSEARYFRRLLKECQKMLDKV
jgi:hypothetical protein